MLKNVLNFRIYNKSKKGGIQHYYKSCCYLECYHRQHKLYYSLCFVNDATGDVFSTEVEIKKNQFVTIEYERGFLK